MFAFRKFPWLFVLLSFVADLRRADAQENVVAYVPNWIDLKAFADTIDYSKLTHINIAFENPAGADGHLSFQKDNDVLIAKAHARGVKVLVSIGGGSASGDAVLKQRYFDLLEASKVRNFAAGLADYVVRHEFDGLDVDIEGPSINQDYGAFVGALAPLLKARGKLLTAALSKGYGGNNVPNATLQLFDLVNIMAYDGAGYWEPNVPGQHSSLEFAKSNVEYWLKRGVPKAKAILGVPFYGYGFGAAFRKRDYPYSEIVASYPGAEDKDEIGKTIWYNGIPTMKKKVELVKSAGLGGVMIWSLDTDGPASKSLLAVIHAGLTPRQPVKP